MHIPVLLHESVEALRLSGGFVAVDATLGEGGHAREILSRVGEGGRLVGIEIDRRMLSALTLADPRLTVVEGNFRDVVEILKSLGIERAHAVLADLGVSARHYREAEWGFSFSDGPLDMRFKPEGQTASDLLNSWNEHQLAEWLLGAGVREGRKVARRLVEERRRQAITRTAQLAEIVAAAGQRPPRGRGSRQTHPATKVFRALREAVTGELEDLRRFIPRAAEAVASGGRIAILTYTSGEERIVREETDRLVKGCICPPGFPVCKCGRIPELRWVLRKGAKPGGDEVKQNPSSRSAKLFIMEKI